LIPQVLIGTSAIGIALGSAYGATAPKNIPLPPPRPPEFVAPAPDIPSPVNPAVIPTPSDNDALRTQVLASGRIIGESLAPIVDPGGCGIAAPLRLDAIVLPDGAKVVLSSAAIMRASLASAIADWVREDLAPAVAGSGDRLAKIDGVGAYECRGRNRVVGAKLSEHAKGNALDLQGFTTMHGRSFAIAASNSVESQSFLSLMKTTACARFMTVLGPGSDSFHEQHLHLDLTERHNGAHMCQWTFQPLIEKVRTPTTH